MSRRHISTSERVKIFGKFGGVCGICNADIRLGEVWEIEHRVPLAQGGEDGGDNLYPAHRSCHRIKTSADATDTARCKRREAAHIGARAPSRTPMPFGRKSPFKKLFSGEVVRRDR